MKLQKYLIESLLDDEEDLIDNNEYVKEKIFYEDCMNMFNLSSFNIKKECSFNNGKPKIYLFTELTSNKKNPEDNIFKGFSTAPIIDYVYGINITKYYDTKKLDPNRYSISKMNKYPMRIDNMHTLMINSFHLLDYCPNISIDNVSLTYLYLNDDIPDINVKQFEFFKSIKHTNLIEFRNEAISRKITIIPRGTIQNIDAEVMRIHIGNIIPNIRDKSELNDENIQLFNDFIDDLYKYNNIGELIIITNNRYMKEEEYIIKKGKNKNSKYILKKY